MAVSDFLESFPNVSSNHCFSDSSNSRLRVLRTPRRLSDVLGFLSRWHTTPRCVPEPQPQPEICAQLVDRKIFSVRAPNTWLPECGRLHRSSQSQRSHPLA